MAGKVVPYMMIFGFTIAGLIPSHRPLCENRAGRLDGHVCIDQRAPADPVCPSDGYAVIVVGASVLLAENRHFVQAILLTRSPESPEKHVDQPSEMVCRWPYTHGLTVFPQERPGVDWLVLNSFYWSSPPGAPF